MAGPGPRPGGLPGAALTTPQLYTMNRSPRPDGWGKQNAGAGYVRSRGRLLLVNARRSRRVTHRAGRRAARGPPARGPSRRGAGIPPHPRTTPLHAAAPRTRPIMHATYDETCSRPERRPALDCRAAHLRRARTPLQPPFLPAPRPPDLPASPAPARPTLYFQSNHSINLRSPTYNLVLN